MQKIVQSVWRTINNQLRWRTPIQVIRIPEVPKIIYSVKHRMSSTYNFQSNGHAEINVKAMKQLILKTTDNGNIENENFLTAILEYRNTPKHNGLSPAEILTL